jgi:hypothetical protein
MFNHNVEKISKLNDSISNYYYAMDGRDYVHGSTIVSAIYDILEATEITINLRKVIKSGFTFDDLPSENDLGFVVADNTVLYIKHNDQPIFQANEFTPLQEILRGWTRIAQGAIDLWIEPSKFLSRRLMIRPKWILSETFNNDSSILVKNIKNDNAPNTIDLYLNNLLVYRQDVIKSR